MRRISRVWFFCLLSFALAISFGTMQARAAGAGPGRAAQTAAQAATGKALTIERIFSAPSLGGELTHGIEWSPDGKRISFLESGGKDGALEMWAMDATTGERKVLVDGNKLKEVMQPEKAKATQSTGLGRVHPENYMWSPDGDSLLFIGSNSMVLLNLKTMKVGHVIDSEQQIEDPKFSPDGQWISFVRDDNVWVVNVASGETKAVTSGGTEEILKGKLDWVYPEELSTGTAYWWSPDSTKIAYYEMDERPVTLYPIMDMSSPVGAMEFTRYPMAGQPNPLVRVGVVPVAGGETKWMDTGSDTNVYLARVEWLRDSQRVAIERLNRAQTRLDLLFCDAATGASQTILTDTDKYWINIADDLYFFADGKHFLWSSERTGFRHYYLYDLSGKLVEPLTSGDWGITGGDRFGPGSASHPAVDEADGYIYFLSNKDDPRDRQLYRVSLHDKGLTQITTRPGTHDILFAPDASAYVDTYSKAATPPRQDLYRADGTRVAVIDENKDPQLAEYDLSPVEFLDLSADDGTKLCAEMIKPLDFDPSHKYPVLIDVYGGPGIQNVLNAWGGEGFLFDEVMAAKGYIIFELDNRGSYYRGHAFETPIYHHFGKVELEDQLTGVKYLESLSYVDPSRIGIWGWSYGGYMTLTAMLNAPDVFKAGVSVAPVTDWRLYDTIYTERYMGTPQENPDGYRDSSPVHHAANLKGKLMLVHATGDDNVHFANTAEMLNEFIDNGKYPASLMIFPGRGHGISDRPAIMLLLEHMTQFLTDNL